MYQAAGLDLSVTVSNDKHAGGLMAIDDELTAARGCLFGLLFSIPLWALIGLAVWLAFRLA